MALPELWTTVAVSAKETAAQSTEMQNPKASSTAAPATVAQLPNRRSKRRVRITQPMRVRNSEPHGQQFDEVLVTINVCKDGLYFATRQATYHPGQRVFVTFPFSEEAGAMNLEYLGRVVRIDKLPRGQFGVAVHLLMTVNLQSDTKNYRYLPSLR